MTVRRAREEKAVYTLATFVDRRESLIVNALRNRVRDMRKAAEEARASYEAGRDDPEVRAQQDASMITNNGYKHMMGLFTEQADQAEEAADELADLIEAWRDTQ